MELEDTRAQESPVARPMTMRIHAALAAALLTAAVVAAQGPGGPRIVAVGDVHGDIESFVGILREAQLVDAERRWIGGRATLVQTGDYLDRGAHVREVLDLLMALEEEAPGAGGRAISLMGNHEAMNMMADVRDVSREAFASFADAESASRLEAAYGAHVELAARRRDQLTRLLPEKAIPRVFQAVGRAEWLAARPPGFIEYIEAFGPDGRYGRWLRARDVTVRIGDTVFLHGGFNPEFVAKNLDATNAQARRELSRWDRLRKALLSRRLVLPSFTFVEILDATRVELERLVAEAVRNGATIPPGSALPPSVATHPIAEFTEIGSWSLVHPEGPLWFRGFATWPSDKGAMLVDQLQLRFGPVRFVVGHTVMSSGRITPRFSGRVFLIDTGMLASVYEGRASALEIAGGRYAAIYRGERARFTERTTRER
jgi:hypothetical protein